MDIHKNARLTLLGRERMVRMVLGGQPPKAVREAVGVCPRTMAKWVKRFEAEGLPGLQDRSSRPHRLREPTAQGVVDRIEALRRQRLTGKAIAAQVGVSPATVSRVLRRLGLNRLSSLEPVEPPRRYQRERPGELIHIDIKKLGRFNHAGHRITGDRTTKNKNRGVGWECVHVAIDDASRVAFSRIRPGQTESCAIAFLNDLIAYYRDLGIVVEAIMTDNGGCYRSRAFQNVLQEIGLRHLFTRPYTPRTNGKAERFIQTALREWAYAVAYDSSQQRAQQLPLWIHHYNWHRPHGSIGAKPPVSKLGLADDNLYTLHTQPAGNAEDFRVR